MQVVGCQGDCVGTCGKSQSGVKREHEAGTVGGLFLHVGEFFVVEFTDEDLAADPPVEADGAVVPHPLKEGLLASGMVVDAEIAAHDPHLAADILVRMGEAGAAF